MDLTQILTVTACWTLSIPVIGQKYTFIKHHVYDDNNRNEFNDIIAPGAMTQLTEPRFWPFLTCLALSFPVSGQKYAFITHNVHDDNNRNEFSDIIAPAAVT